MCLFVLHSHVFHIHNRFNIILSIKNNTIIIYSNFSQQMSVVHLLFSAVLTWKQQLLTQYLGIAKHVYIKVDRTYTYLPE